MAKNGTPKKKCCSKFKQGKPCKRCPLFFLTPKSTLKALSKKEVKKLAKTEKKRLEKAA